MIDDPEEGNKEGADACASDILPVPCAEESP
jgi:hypothetical protein